MIPREELFECRRYAPQRTHGVGTGENNQKFPVMLTEDWCGEYEPRVNEELRIDFDKSVDVPPKSVDKIRVGQVPTVTGKGSE